NNTNTRNLSERSTWYEYPAPYGTQYGLSNSQKINNNHRLNARLDWKISRTQQLTSRTTLSYQGHRPTTTTEGYSNNDTDLDTVGMESITFRPLSYSSSSSQSIMRGVNANQFLQYRLRLGVPGRTITVTARAGYRDNRAARNVMTNNAEPVPFDSPLYESLYNEYFGAGGSWYDMSENPLLFIPIYEHRNIPTYTYNVGGGVNYNEPIAENWTLTLQYNLTYRNQTKEQGAWYTESDYAVTDQSRQNDALTINSATNTLSHRVGPGIRYSKNRNTFVFRVLYENLSRNGDFNNGANISSLVDKHFHSAQYFAMFRYAFNKQNTLRIQFRSSSDMPSVSQLHNIFDVTSPQNISVGNSNLMPEYSHSGSIRYILSLPDKGQTFMAMIRGEYYQNALSTSRLYNPQGWALPEDMDGILLPKDENGKPYRPTQITSYENISGMWSVRANISYGLPLPFIKCNLNLAANVGYSVTPSAVYDAGRVPAQLLENVVNHNFSVNRANNIGYTLRAALGSNISENIDFTLSWRGTYNQAWNSATEADYGEKILNNYFRHTASASVKWIFGAGFTLTANAAYHQYLGYTNSYNEQYILCNAYLGKQLFKSRRGEILVGVNDILNQNRAFSRSTGSGYTRNVLNSTVGRYVMVQFVYNLRHFGKNASRNISDYEGMDSSGTRQRAMGDQRMMRRYR
ncbi:MAG: outer membrane beta-barrel protein, partial [Alistipes sp.]|nr:outer membrane beta-barrel protein [Alistipes sp.]